MSISPSLPIEMNTVRIATPDRQQLCEVGGSSRTSQFCAFSCGIDEKVKWDTTPISFAVFIDAYRLSDAARRIPSTRRAFFNAGRPQWKVGWKEGGAMRSIFEEKIQAASHKACRALRSGKTDRPNGADMRNPRHPSSDQGSWRMRHDRRKAPRLHPTCSQSGVSLELNESPFAAYVLRQRQRPQRPEYALPAFARASVPGGCTTTDARDEQTKRSAGETVHVFVIPIVAGSSNLLSCVAQPAGSPCMESAKAIAGATHAPSATIIHATASPFRTSSSFHPRLQ